MTSLELYTRNKIRMRNFYFYSFIDPEHIKPIDF